MVQPSHSLLPILTTLTLLLSLLSSTLASTTVHYFPNPSCNAHTALSEDVLPGPASADTQCHYAPDETIAMYVDGIDDGCTGKSTPFLLL